MSEDLNPQFEQMADESMVRNLAAQAVDIWPQERELFLRAGLPARGRILDAGCGTGEISSRLAGLYPATTVDGVDIIESHLGLARRKYADMADRLRFARGDVYGLDFTDETFDLTVCRHVLQAIPHAPRVIHIGRHALAIMADLGFADLTLDYVVVDPLRVPRETFAQIWEAWRDGYTDAVAEHTRFSRQEVLDLWNDMIACIRNPRGYAVWQVPVVRARKP
jgi:SAM-dependent methyltransferase